MSRGIRNMGDYVDMELRHSACRTLDWADGARLVEKVGELGDVRREWSRCLPRLVHRRFDLPCAVRQPKTAYLKLAGDFRAPPRTPVAVAVSMGAVRIDSGEHTEQDTLTTLGSFIRRQDANTLASILFFERL